MSKLFKISAIANHLEITPSLLSKKLKKVGYHKLTDEQKKAIWRYMCAEAVKFKEKHLI